MLLFAARMFDYFDAGIMEGLQHRLVSMTELRTQGNIATAAGNTVSLHSKVTYLLHGTTALATLCICSLVCSTRCTHKSFMVFVVKETSNFQENFIFCLFKDWPSACTHFDRLSGKL